MNFKFKLLTISGLFLGLLALVPSVSSVWASKLILNPPSGSIEQGDDLIVDVVVQGNNELIDGVDAVVTYDPDYLELKEITDGDFFASYPVKADDAGKFRVTALAAKEGVKIFDDIVIVTLTFEILDSGETELNIEYETDSTAESNVPLHGTSVDSLTEVTGGSYNVVATEENLERARSRKAQGQISPLIIFIPLMILVIAGVWYWWRKRKPKEDYYTPEPFPMDRPPTV